MDANPNPIVQLAGEQFPLLEASQLQVGDILVGIMSQFAWEVTMVERSKLIITKLPRVEVVAHACQFDGTDKTCQMCGAKMRAMSVFTPTEEGKARTHIIRPRGEILKMDPNGLYVGLDSAGKPKFLNIRGTQWNEALPLVPLLHKVWMLPEEMVGLLRDGGDGQADPEYGTIQFV